MASTCTHVDTIRDVAPSGECCVFEPGEYWYWCYADPVALEVSGAGPSPSHP